MTTSQNYDIVILGTGPAGLQAAIHASRKKVSVLVLGKENKSSLFNAHVENFCCLFNVAGADMIRNGRQQAQSFGAHFADDDVLSIQADGNGFTLEIENATIIAAKALVIATGTHRNKLGVKGEKEYIGKGVSYCVDCDGHFYKGETVAVVGDESAAVDGALTLTQIAGQVHLICKQLAVSDTLQKKLADSTVTIHSGVKIKAVHGETEVQAVELDNGQRIAVNGVFVEQGAKGLMQLATTLGIALDDEMRFINTDKSQATNIPGIFAAGDVCGPPWQMAKAVGEGCVAGISAAEYAKKAKSEH